MPSTMFSRSPRMMPLSFLSSNSVTFDDPSFDTLNVTGPAGIETVAGEHPLSLSFMATVVAPGAAFDELPPQPAAVTATSAITTPAAPFRLHDPDTCPRSACVRW